MKSYFADTFYYLALLNRQDENHNRVVALTDSLTGRVFTTDWILVELGDALAASRDRHEFGPFFRELRRDPEIIVVRCSRALLRRGVEFYEKRPDKHWSPTDCISFVVMTDHKIRDALTGDHHFEQAGFIALLQ